MNCGEDDSMIPKVIHYCWFGGNDIPDEFKKYMDSWKTWCPDYTIKRWDEDNFDINICKYVKEAYEQKKWAFVSDYVRLYVLYNEGGVYVDTDVEILRNIDEFLKHDAFSGFESSEFIPTGIMASKKEFPLFGELLKLYDDRSFLLKNGTMDLTTNCSIITDFCMEKGLVLNCKKQNIMGFELYPPEYFCPKNPNNGKMKMTENTYCIHHFAGSWLPRVDRTIIYLNKNGSFVCKILAIPFRFLRKMRNVGFLGTIRFVIDKIRK